MSWHYRLGLEPRWGISLVEADWKSKDAALRASRPVPNPPGRYFADPFVIERDGRTYCFVEDYVHARGKAHITVLEYRSGVATELGSCLDEPFHLSFPFVFEYEGQLYLCPEASASRSVRLYRCTEFPLRWELARVTLSGFPALDTLLFERQGRWWLLTCRFADTNDPFGSELHVFHAESPLSEQWQPLPGNPVTVFCCFWWAIRRGTSRPSGFCTPPFTSETAITLPPRSCRNRPAHEPTLPKPWMANVLPPISPCPESRRYSSRAKTARCSCSAPSCS